jgi:hypothetical protein
METESKLKEKRLKDIFMYVLGALIVIGFFVTLIFLIKAGTFENTLNLVVGALIGAFATVVSYFYGSSKSSQNKDETISNVLNKNK